MPMRESITKVFGDAFSVSVIPTLKDNFSYLVHDHTTGALAAVDVNADFDPILKYIQDHAEAGLTTARLRTILSTHKHWDHAGGNLKLREQLNMATSTPDFAIIGGARDDIPGVTQRVKDGDTVAIGGLRVDVFDVPCHTKGHVLFRVWQHDKPNAGAALFTGDTMFLGGLGAFFEGDASDMCTAMKKIYHMNDDASGPQDAATFIFPGHEYTAGFMVFSAAQLASKSSFEKDLAFVKKQGAHYAANVAQGLPSVPSSLQDEKTQNLFLRVADGAFRTAMGVENEVKLMDMLYNACD